MYPGTLAKSIPDKIAYVMAAGGESVSYGQLDERSNRGAQLFRSLGLGHGDSIALCMENHPRFFEICWAAQRSGLVYTAISSRLTPPEVEYIVKDCGAKVFITSHAKRDVATALAQPLAGLTRYMVGGDTAEYASYEEALTRQPAGPVDDEIEGIDMLYSSGTTGRPKGVRIEGAGRPIGSPPALVMLLQGLYGAGQGICWSSPRRWTSWPTGP